LATATAKNTNKEAHIHAKVDGKKVIISEATIRRDLKFKNEGGVDCLSNEVIFEQLPLIGVGKDFSRKDTPLFPIMLVTSQEEELAEGLTMSSAPQHTPIIQPSIFKPQRKQKPRKPRRQETQETQPSHPTDEALNEENVPIQSNDPPLSRVNTLGKSSAKEQSLDKEDASKQGRNIADIDVDAEITLVDETIEDQGRYDDQEMFDTSVLDDEEEILLKEA
nr:hypothetical protein [Tanacetum cinerariifolium]